ncbi:MAG: hypothetical protein M1326_04780, partial [Cyanobacteria bacterium]|nr:hypothetical protein [Cyanobacteriota bacterium]
MILKIGFIGVDSILFDDDPNIKLFEESKEFIKKAVEPHQIVFSEGIFIDRPESQRELINLIEKWEEVRLDLIIVQSVGFNTTSISPLDVALSQKNVPIVLWALPEPEFKKDASLQKGSWCGINMQAFNLKRVGVKYEYIYGLPGNEILLKIKEILKVFEVIKKLRKSTIGAIGSRPPGYYDASLDELSLRKALGIRFEVFDLAEVFSNFESISRKEIEEVSKQLYPINKTDIDTYIENSTKLYISIKKLVKEYDLAALTVKCWPDMERLLKIIPCSVVGALGNLN